MNRFQAMTHIIKKLTGVVCSGEAIWDEIETAARECEEPGAQWITLQDDNIEKWEAYVEITQGEDYIDVVPKELIITPKNKGSVFAKKGFALYQPIFIEF